MDFKNEKNITIFEHPLIQHKISILRDKNTGTNEFRKLVEEIAMLEGFEALGDLPLQDVEIETPIEKCMTPMISGRKLAIVPILRAGLGMVPGVLALVPSAKVGHIGMYRDEETRIPHEYYCISLFENTENKERHRKLDAALDSIRQKYGNDKITRASIMNSKSGIARKARAQMQNELETRKKTEKGKVNGNI